MVGAVVLVGVVVVLVVGAGAVGTDSIFRGPGLDSFVSRTRPGFSFGILIAGPEELELPLV